MRSRLSAVLVLLISSTFCLKAADFPPPPAVVEAGLPAFRHVGVVLDYKDLKYNPCDDVIIPSVVRTEHLTKPLGKYYMYYAPHNAPGGICMAYADSLEGPWKECDENPLIKREWAPNYNVSHVSGPHAIWNEEENRLFLYFHGENDITRLASSTDGINFKYENISFTTKQFADISEASYARIFRYNIPGKDNRFIALVMGNNKGTRKIYLAWSKDGRSWETRSEPLIEPKDKSGQLAQAWLLPWCGKLYMIYHDYNAKGTDLHVSVVDPALEHVKYIGIFYDHRTAGQENVAQMSPCLIEENGKLYLFTNIGPRLKQKIALAIASVADEPGKLIIHADARTVINTMRGGIGASWHAIEEPIPIVKGRSHGGSGWGGYPPAEDDAAWQQIDRHARWLGLDWNRVEFEQRIYEPERGKFTWDSAEMKILYRILDLCEKNKSDVFLQQMWGNVKWNTYPEWRDDAVWRVHSAPLSVDDFGEGLATLVEHLIKTRHYTCIKWLCINNEPGFNWSWWNEPPNKPLPLKPGLAAVRKALDARGISIPISGPDMSCQLPPCDSKHFDFHELLGAYDFHSYNENFDWKSKGQMQREDKSAADWCAFAHKNGKPFFVSEFGTMANGWGGDHAGPAGFDSVLKDAELLVRRINVGVDGLNRWSFVNRGDLDGHWQFIETWDRKEKKLLKEYTPRANTYFGLGLLMRFIAKHSDVLSCKVDGGKLDSWQRVFAAALRSPKGNLTITVVNDASSAFDLTLDVEGLARGVNLCRYSFDQSARDKADMKVESQAEFRLMPAAGSFKDKIVPMSITVYSAYKFTHTDDGAMSE